MKKFSAAALTALVLVAGACGATASKSPVGAFAVSKCATQSDAQSEPEFLSFELTRVTTWYHVPSFSTVEVAARREGVTSLIKLGEEARLLSGPALSAPSILNSVVDNRERFTGGPYLLGFVQSDIEQYLYSMIRLDSDGSAAYAPNCFGDGSSIAVERVARERDVTVRQLLEAVAAGDRTIIRSIQAIELPNYQPTWVELDPYSRALIDAPPAIRETFRTIAVSFELDDRWRTDDLVACVHAVRGWNVCVDIVDAKQQPSTPMFVDQGDRLELWLMPKSEVTETPLSETRSRAVLVGTVEGDALKPDSLIVIEPIDARVTPQLARDLYRSQAPQVLFRAKA